MGKGRDKRKRRERKAAKRGSHKRMTEPPFNDSFNDPDAPVYAWSSQSQVCALAQ
jgi:hypothetical protein